MHGILLLEDGTLLRARAFGAAATRVGEVVFNTAMSGYQEVLTDPSYAEQVVVMTSPHIGNTGINEEDSESSRIHVAGFVGRSFTRTPSSWRATWDLGGALEAAGVPALEGLDTRALVRRIRTVGAMSCAVSTDGSAVETLRERLAAWPGMQGRALARELTCARPWVAAAPVNPVLRIAVLDGGIKQNILRLLVRSGAYVRVHPLTDPPEALLEGVDAVLVSNGPGDPAALPEVVENLRRVMEQVPTVGICLGHQLLGLAVGAETYKLRYGHRGANHPVRDERSGKVAITSQNHGFAVSRESLEAVGATVTHTHLNDGTVSGFVHRERRVYAVQYHPEAAPGPHDATGLIDEFIAFARS